MDRRSPPPPARSDRTIPPWARAALERTQREREEAAAAAASANAAAAEAPAAEAEAAPPPSEEGHPLAGEAAGLETGGHPPGPIARWRPTRQWPLLRDLLSRQDWRPRQLLRLRPPPLQSSRRFLGRLRTPRPRREDTHR